MDETSAPPDSAVTHLDLFMYDFAKVRFLCSCRSVSAPHSLHNTASHSACTRARQAGCLARFPALRSLKLIQQVPHTLLCCQPAHLSLVVVELGLFTSWVGRLRAVRHCYWSSVGWLKMHADSPLLQRAELHAAGERDVPRGARCLPAPGGPVGG